MTQLLSASGDGQNPGRAWQEDVELMSRLARRDMEAMSQLYDRYSAMVNGLALRITGHPGDAAEVMQEVFTQVWRQAANYESGRGSVVSWLCTITRTRALDLVRARARRPALEAERAPDDCRGEPQDRDEPSPEAHVIAGQSVVMVKNAMTQLSAPERRAIELAYYEDLSHSEIAALTGLPLGTVKTHIARAVRKLKMTVEAMQGQEAART